MKDNLAVRGEWEKTVHDYAELSQEPARPGEPVTPHRQLQVALLALVDVEWGNRICPYCAAVPEEGHVPNCLIKVALLGIEPDTR